MLLLSKPLHEETAEMHGQEKSGFFEEFQEHRLFSAQILLGYHWRQGTNSRQRLMLFSGCPVKFLHRFFDSVFCIHSDKMSWQIMLQYSSQKHTSAGLVGKG